MNPDQLYTTRALQHDDLRAEAGRERRLRQEVERPVGGRRGLRALLAAGAGGAGAALLALVLAAPWGAASAGGAARPLNRTFADEARYTPTVEEYLAVMPPNLDAGEALAVRRAPVAAAEPAECKVVGLVGLALCAPGAPAPERAGAVRVGGPR